jgi:hypothetical protein
VMLVHVEKHLGDVMVHYRHILAILVSGLVYVMVMLSHA